MPAILIKSLRFMMLSRLYGLIVEIKKCESNPPFLPSQPPSIPVIDET
jgi:hypothetical protein